MPQRSAGVRELSAWEAVWMPLGEGEAERLTIGRGSAWKPVEVPRQLSAREGRQAVWYRTEFPRPDHSGRVVLRIGGAFLATNAWLNGKLLGSHYGYFAPFGFDLTPYLKPENLLVICCESPVEKDPEQKRHIMGFFNDGELKSYPASAYSSLPEKFAAEVPVGLWRPVELQYVGPIAIDWVRLRPGFEGGDGRLEVEARLRNLDGRQMEGELSLELARPDGPPLRLRRQVRVAGASEMTTSIGLNVAGARRWSPWRFGEPHLYEAKISISVQGRPSANVRESFGFRDLRVRAAPEGWEVHVNGQPAFIRGANYIPSLRLDQLDADSMRADLQLAREANLDALRLHAHVLPDEFYRLADEAGILLIADLPLTLAYAYHATAEEARFFETVVRDQVPEMGRQLRNRPSILFWVGHDDPLDRAVLHDRVGFRRCGLPQLAALRLVAVIVGHLVEPPVGDAVGTQHLHQGGFKFVHVFLRSDRNAHVRWPGGPQPADDYLLFR